MATDEVLAAFCDEHSSRIFQLLWLQVGDQHIAEELAQDTLIKVCRHWPRLRRMDNPDGWITTTALNLARSWWRRRYAEQRARRRARAGPLAVLPVDTAGAVVLRGAVAELPRRQREAVVLRYWADLSVEEAARVMGCAVGTVKALTSQAVANLRKHDFAQDVDSWMSTPPTDSA